PVESRPSVPDPCACSGRMAASPEPQRRPAVFLAEPLTKGPTTMRIVGNTAKTPAARQAYEDGREALIKEFAPTIKYLASRLAVRLPSYLDAEDLFSVGLIGILNAFDRYDPTREAKFKTYAEYRIRGAMLDEIRSMDWIPRSVRDRITLLQRTCDGLQKRLSRPPTEEEIGEAMGLNQEELADFLVRSQGDFDLSLDGLASQ